MKDRAKYAMDYFVSQGWQQHQAAGIVGNLMAESGLNTGARNKGDGRDGTDSIGIGQWNSGRAVALKSFAAKRGKSYDDFDTQLAFVNHELNGVEKSAGDLIRRSVDVRSATEGMIMYERPAGSQKGAQYAHNYTGRQRFAAELMGGTYSALTATKGGAAAYSASTEVPVYQDRQELQPDKESPSFWQLQKDAFNQESTLPWLYDHLTDDTQPDPNYKGFTDTQLKDALAARNLPAEQYASWAEGSISEADFYNRLNKAQENFERQTRLNEAGLKGTGLQIANAMLDIPSLAADIAVGSIAPVYVFGKRAGRVGRTLQGALAGAAGGAAAEGVAYSVNPNRDAADLLMGTVFGFGVGGVVGRLQSRAETVTEGIAIQKLARKQLDEYEGIGHNGSTVGAAKAPRSEPFLDEEGLGLVRHNELPDSYAKGFRFDLAAQLDKSKSVVTRLGGNALVQDPAGKAGGRINSIAATEEKTLFNQQWITGIHRTYNPQRDAYFKRNNIPVSQRSKAEVDFNEKVTEYIRDRKADRGERYDPEVKIVGEKIAALQTEMLEMAQNPFKREGLEAEAVKGMEAVVKDRHYMMRSWSTDKLRDFESKYVEGTLDDLIFGAIRSANADMDEELLKKVAAGFASAIRKRSHGVSDALGRPVGAENFDVLKKALVEEGSLEEAAAETFLKRFTKQPDAGRNARAKKRVLMDENYQMDKRALRKDGTVSDEPLKLTDIMDNDAMSLFTSYSRQMSGLIALARVRIKDPSTGELLVNGFKSDADFDRFLKAAAQSGADNGATKGQLEADQKRLQFAYDYIKGRPSEAEGTSFGTFARLARKFHFTRVMNQVGFAQIPEVGRIIGVLGVKAAFTQLPTMRRAMNQSGETILKSGLADDVEKIWGLGGERLYATSSYRYDATTGAHEAALGGRLGTLEKWLDKGGRVTSEMSGMTQANILSQRWAGAAIIQKFADMAEKGGKGFSAKRLADLGLDKDMSERVFKMLREKGNLEFSEGVITGKKVSRLLLDNWADQEAAQAFTHAVFRLSGQIIQRNDIGALAMFMSHPAAKMVLQFRTFIAGAYTNQTLKGLNMRDGAEFKAAILTSGLAGLVYMMQAKVQAIGREDADEFLENRLSWEEIGKAGFSRAGWASILPMLIDSAAPAVGLPAQFSNTRTTGQVSNIAFGSPSTGYLDDLPQATSALLRATYANDWSQEEARSITRALPFGNALPVVWGMNQMIGDLPKFKPRD